MCDHNTFLCLHNQIISQLFCICYNILFYQFYKRYRIYHTGLFPMNLTYLQKIRILVILMIFVWFDFRWTGAKWLTRW